MSEYKPDQSIDFTGLSIRTLKPCKPRERQWTEPEVTPEVIEMLKRQDNMNTSIKTFGEFFDRFSTLAGVGQGGYYITGNGDVDELPQYGNNILIDDDTKALSTQSNNKVENEQTEGTDKTEPYLLNGDMWTIIDDALAELFTESKDKLLNKEIEDDFNVSYPCHSCGEETKVEEGAIEQFDPDMNFCGRCLAAYHR